MFLSARGCLARTLILGTALSVAPCFAAGVFLMDPLQSTSPTCFTGQGCLNSLQIFAQPAAGAVGQLTVPISAFFGGGSGPFFPAVYPGTLVLSLAGWSPGDTGTFNTEMLQLDLPGAVPLLRESPTLQSSGQTTITETGGDFRISSFFDVFTELSVDGGQTWLPATGPTHLQSPVVDSPEPATWLVPGAGVLMFAVRKRRRS